MCNDKCCAIVIPQVTSEINKRCVVRDILKALKGITYFYFDAKVILDKDPAIRNKPLGFTEILLYSSFWAMFFYRFAHLLFVSGFPFVPRLISQLARFITGIEIHPGAEIGPGLFIDHGMGVVIGETAIVGKNVLIFHGVTLGGVDSRKGRRHPMVGDNVIIGAGAKVLGAITLGDNAKIGAQSVVLSDVSEGATAVGIPARIITHKCRQFA